MADNLKYYKIKDIPMNIHGRIDTSYDLIPLLSNGHGIEVSVQGAQLWADVEADHENFEPWAAIEINGELISRFMLDKGSHRLCLLRGVSPEQTTRVKLYRELQAMSDDPKTCITIKGLWTDGKFTEPHSYDHRFEFIGDSICSGEGTYGARTDMDWTAYCMSYSRTYANLIGKELNAECRVISQGGWGVFSGWDNDRRHVIPDYYEHICGLASGYALSTKGGMLPADDPDIDVAKMSTGDRYGAGRAYDFSSWVPEVIFINLGTNDREGFNQPPFTDPDTGKTYSLRTDPDGSFCREDMELIINAAVGFLKKVRKNNPASHIVWLYGMLGYDLNLTLAEALNRYRVESGDSNVAYLELPSANDRTIGARSHPGYESHRIVAGILTDYLKTVL